MALGPLRMTLAVGALRLALPVRTLSLIAAGPLRTVATGTLALIALAALRALAALLAAVGIIAARRIGDRATAFSRALEPLGTIDRDLAVAAVALGAALAFGAAVGLGDDRRTAALAAASRGRPLP